MIGKKITVTTSIIISVSRLDDESQTVRLAFGSSDDGSMNGNRLRPAVAMMPLKTTMPSQSRFRRLGRW
jgi:hypothetical protein